MDGSIRVGTKIDTSGAEKDLGKLQKEVEKTAERIQEAGEKVKTTFTGMSAKQLEKSLEKANAELEKTLALQKEVAEQGDAVQESYKPMYDKATTEEQAQRIDEMAANELEPINAKWAELNEKANQQRDIIAQITAELEGMKAAQETATTETEEGAQALEEAGDEADALSIAAKRAGKAISDGIGKGIKKVIRLGLAVLGVRSAFMVLRRAASAALQDNEELSNQLNSIWNVLGTAIAPVIEKLVNWLTIAISYVNAFVKALWGVDLVAKANEKALKRQQKAAEKAASVAGFDEINKVADTTSASEKKNGQFQTVDVDTAAVDKFAEKVKELFPLIAGIAAGLAAWKIASDFGANLAQCASWFLIIAGAGTAITSFIDILNNGLDWNNLATLIGGVALAVTGLAIAFGATAAAVGLLIGGIMLVIAGFKDWLENGKSAKALTAIETGILAIGGAIALLVGGWIPLVIAAVVGLVTAIIMYWDDIVAAVKKGWKWICDLFSDIGQWCYNNIIKPVVDWVTWLFNKVVSIFKKIGTTVVNFVSNAFKSVINGVLSGFEKLVNTFVNAINGAIGLINKIPGVNIPKLNTLSIPRLAQGGIVNNPGKGVPVIAGEAGKEAILPLDQNTGWMDILAEKIGAGSGKIVVPIYLNGRKIAEEVIDLTKQRKFATNGAV